jgi:hypothetical protein
MESPPGDRAFPLVSTFARSRWTDEATRLHHRYQLEVVEACGLCPWAERARVDDNFRARVLFQTDARETGASLAAIDDFIADERADVGVIIFPRLRLGRLDFERFMGTIRDADAVRHRLGGIPFVFAAFHPEALADSSEPERLIPFLRRTPDPTIQLLRSTLLERVRNGTPQGTQFVDMRALNEDVSARTPISLRERIATTNLATVERMGIAELARRFDAIAHDRNTTYRALEIEAGAELAEAPRA